MAEITPTTSTDTINDTLTESRFIMLSGAITNKKATEVVSKLIAYELQGTADITIVLNSPGGYCNEGFAIYDIMKIIASKVNIVGTGHICSMASLILCGGTKGKRFVTPHTRIMLHQPSMGTDGPLADIEIATKELSINRDLLYAAIVRNSNMTAEELMIRTHRDCWLSAQEAVDYGLADKILEDYKAPKKKKQKIESPE